MMKSEKDTGRPDETGEHESNLSAANGRLYWCGFVVALLGFVAYFGLTLQQPGSASYTWIHEVLVLLGASATVIAVWRGRRRWLSWVGAGFVALLACLLLAYVHVISFQLPSTEGVIELAQQAPDFSLPGPDGQSVSLEVYRGKPLVLVFYRGYW